MDTYAICPYTIYAVQYAQRNTSSSELFVGDHHNTPMKMAYFVWALTNGAQTVVVDLGFTEEVGATWTPVLALPFQGFGDAGHRLYQGRTRDPEPFSL